MADLDYSLAGHSNFQRVYYSLNTGGVAPTANYDSADTVGVGINFKESDMVKDTTDNKVYICVGATPTSALWSLIT